MITEYILWFLGALATIGLGCLVWKKAEPPRKLDELAQVDLSAPLRVRELLTEKGILKLAYRWGVRKTFSLFWLFYAAIFGVSLYIIRIRMGVPFIMESIVYYMFTCSTTITIMTYSLITRALRARKF